MKKKSLIIIILGIIIVLLILGITFIGNKNEEKISEQSMNEIQKNIDAIVLGNLEFKIKEVKTEEEQLAEKYEKAPKTEVNSEEKEEYNYFSEENLNPIEKQIINIAEKFGKSEELNEALEKINNELNKIAFTGQKRDDLSEPYKRIVNMMIEIYNQEQLSDDEKETVQQFMQIMRVNSKDNDLNEKIDKIINENQSNVL